MKYNYSFWQNVYSFSKKIALPEVSARLLGEMSASADFRAFKLAHI